MTRSTALLAVLALHCLGICIPRAVAITFTVNTNADSGPGSLRSAIANAGNNDTINFSLPSPSTILLASGELLITNNVTISGPGATSLIISGNNSSRVFHIGTSNTATISGLTISDGAVNGGGVGGGIYVDSATVTLTNCLLKSNQASGGSTAGGGGIYSSQSQLTVNGCTLDGNVASGNGGAIYNVGPSLTIDHSTVSNNSALTGGGVFNASGTVSVKSSLVYANGATHGGGIANVGMLGTATLILNNCTLSSNAVSGTSATGSQIQNARQLTNASATISNSTLLSNNVASSYTGGALSNENGAAATIGNTILQAGLQEHTIVNTGASTVTSAGYNLAFDTGGGFLTGSGDQISTDPLLDIGAGPRDNGGPTFTIPLQANSPAIDKGKRDAIPALASAVDQRGEPRPFNDPNIANAVGGDESDIGAYEADLRLTKLARMTNDLQFNFTTIVGKSYQLEKRSSLAAGNWGSFGSMISGNGGIVPLTATGAFPNTVQFYHVLQSP